MQAILASLDPVLLQIATRSDPGDAVPNPLTAERRKALLDTMRNVEKVAGPSMLLRRE